MRRISEILLDIKAVSLSPKSPYTWASGIKSPIYCDNRLTLSYPQERIIIESSLIDLVKEKFPDVEVLMGTATAGIPHAAIMAWEMKIPMGFVRGKAKDHGKENRIEGRLEQGQKVVVVEDLISTGGSSISTVEALKEAGADVLGIVSIFDYELKKSEESFKATDIKHYSLTSYSELIDVALEKNYIEEESMAKLNAWRMDPTDETWIEK